MSNQKSLLFKLILPGSHVVPLYWTSGLNMPPQPGWVDIRHGFTVSDSEIKTNDENANNDYVFQK